MPDLCHDPRSAALRAQLDRRDAVLDRVCRCSPEPGELLRCLVGLGGYGNVCGIDRADCDTTADPCPHGDPTCLDLQRCRGCEADLDRDDPGVEPDRCRACGAVLVGSWRCAVCGPPPLADRS